MPGIRCSSWRTPVMIEAAHTGVTDGNAADLIKNKKNFHAPYTAAGFEHGFRRHFHIARQSEIPGSGRVLYLMKKIGSDEPQVETEPHVQIEPRVQTEPPAGA